MVVTKTFDDAQKIIIHLEILNDIVVNGVRCSHSAKLDKYFVSEMNSVFGAVQIAAREQAKKDIVTLKQRLVEILDTL